MQAGPLVKALSFFIHWKLSTLLDEEYEAAGVFLCDRSDPLDGCDILVVNRSSIERER